MNPQVSEHLKSLNQLKLECHQLIEQVARRPGAAKLLLGIKGTLEMYASYKANRVKTTPQLTRKSEQK